MTVLQSMQSAALRLVGQRPQVFFGSPNLLEQEICDLVNEVAHEIAERHDWQSLIKIHEVSGDGEAAAFPLPADYQRQLVRSELQTGNAVAWRYRHVPDINNYMAVKGTGFAGVPGIWSIFGGMFNVFPAPTSEVSYFPYISKNYARNSSGLEIPLFTDDSDTFVLDERLLTLGLVWKWRENKKLDYSGDREAFEEAISRLSAKDGGSNVIRESSSFSSFNTYPAYPWTLG